MYAANKTLQDHIKKYITLFSTLVVFLIFSVIANNFLSFNNILILLRQMSTLLFISLGMTIVFIAGELDLSLGVVTILGSAFVMLFLRAGMLIVPSILLTVLIAFVLGSFTGIFVSYLRFPSAVMTLGTRLLFGGIVFAVTKARNIYENIPSDFLQIGQGHVGKIPIPAIISIVVFLVLHYIFTSTKFSRQLYATGYDKATAISLGIKAKFLKALAFAIAAGITAVGGILLSSITGLYSAMSVQGVYLLESIAAVYIGMTVLKQGEPHILGTFVGVFLIATVRNGINNLGLQIQIQYFIIGSVFIASILIESLIERGSRIQNEN